MLYFGPFRLDSERLLLSVDERPLPLGPKVVRTLLAFTERPGEVLAKRELLDFVWPEGFVEEGNLAQNVYVLRKVLRRHWRDCIETVPRRGYLFSGAVSDAPPQRTRNARWYYGAAAAAFAVMLSFTLMHATARPGPSRAGLSANGERLFTMGTYYWKQRTQAGVQKSIRYFRAVIASDPRNARGYAALAEAYAIEGNYSYGPLKPAQAYRRARTAARQALNLDPGLAEAHAALGIAEDVKGTLAAAREQFRQALELDPSNASARQWYGSALLEQGRNREAFVQLKKAAQLDPVSVATLAWLSNAAYLSRHYPEAVVYAREALDLSPERIDAYVGLGLGYEALGNYRAAENAYRGYAAHCPTCKAEAAALLAHAYAASGDYAHAQAQLAIAKSDRGMGKPGAMDMAVVFVALGNRSEALATLGRAQKQMPSEFPVIPDERLDVVRTDIRFRKYLKLPA
ncbi:MAG TPA: tetratricopeptide repeat protein [Candidatus Rubrimentiphilum sp.]|nr:tetratricopeptide repeat protein [Candidatus Rubrimentiphilum sp.]